MDPDGHETLYRERNVTQKIRLFGFTKSSEKIARTALCVEFIRIEKLASRLKILKRREPTAR